jgi:hypothetical protein
MQALNDFFTLPGFNIIGGLATLFSMLVLLFTIISWYRGILPAWWRLGIGLSRRKIAIFAENEYSDLKKLLVDSKLFQASNIEQVGKSSIKSAEELTLLLVHWKPFENNIDEILAIKKDSAALIIYAPHSDGPLPPLVAEKINRHRNSILVNFRGRLLNDILTCMITTSFGEK